MTLDNIGSTTEPINGEKNLYKQKRLQNLKEQKERLTKLHNSIDRDLLKDEMNQRIEMIGEKVTFYDLNNFFRFFVLENTQKVDLDIDADEIIPEWKISDYKNSKLQELIPDKVRSTYKQLIEKHLHKMLESGITIPEDQRKDYFEMLTYYGYTFPEEWSGELSLTIDTGKKLKKESYIASKFGNNEIDSDSFIAEALSHPDLKNFRMSSSKNLIKEFQLFSEIISRDGTLTISELDVVSTQIQKLKTHKNFPEVLYNTYYDTIGKILKKFLDGGITIAFQGQYSEILKLYGYKLPKGFTTGPLTIKNGKQLKKENMLSAKFGNDEINYSDFAQELLSEENLKKLEKTLAEHSIELVETTINGVAVCAITVGGVIVGAIVGGIVGALSPTILVGTVLSPLASSIILLPFYLQSVTNAQSAAMPAVPYLATIGAIVGGVAGGAMAYEEYGDTKFVDFSDKKNLNTQESLLKSQLEEQLGVSSGNNDSAINS